MAGSTRLAASPFQSLQTNTKLKACLAPRTPPSALLVQTKTRSLTDADADIHEEHSYATINPLSRSGTTSTPRRCCHRCGDDCALCHSRIVLTHSAALTVSLRAASLGRPAVSQPPLVVPFAVPGCVGRCSAHGRQGATLLEIQPGNSYSVNIMRAGGPPPLQSTEDREGLGGGTKLS